MTEQEEHLILRWKTNFFSIWSGQSISLITSELVQFSIIWWLTDTTGSATVLAISTMIALIPKAVLGPLIGALLDRWNHRVVLIASDIVVALGVMWLLLCISFNDVQVWHIYLVILIRAIGGAFHMSTMLVSTSLLVPHDFLSRVAGMNQMIRGIVMVIVPPLGAILLDLISMKYILALDIIGAIIAIIPLLFIAIPQPKQTKSLVKKKSVWKNIREGLDYIKQWDGAVEMLIISTLVNFIMRPVFSLTAILVIDNFGGEMMQYGWMAAAIGLGFLIGGMFLSLWGGFSRKMQTSLFAIVGSGLAIFVVSLTPSHAFILGIGAIFVASFMMPLCMGPIEALVQSSVDPTIQGRVFSIMNSVSVLISPLSLAIAGPIFDVCGPKIWYLVGGIIVVVIGILGLLKKKILNFGVISEKNQHKIESKPIVDSLSTK